MAEYALFRHYSGLVEQRDDPPVGDISICPLLCQFQLPCHSQAEHSSLNGLKAWGEGKKLCHDIAFLLVQGRGRSNRG